MQHASYRADIDGLRALAILAVVAYHASASLLPGGFVGVDIFFVISGYLITGIILRDVQAGQFSIAQFYRRRVRRIFPALLVVLASVWVIGWFALLPHEYKELGKHMGSAALFISNFVLWKESGYFDSAAELKPLLHLWSLAVEEQFYLVWPILVWAAWKWHRHVLGLIVGIAVLSLVANIALTPRAAELSFYWPLTRFWELMAGGLLAYGERFRPLNFSARLRNCFAWSGMALIALACIYFDKAQPFPGWRALLPVMGATLLIAANNSWLNRHVLANKPMVAIGLISYPLYLWHWPLLSLLRITEPTAPASMIGAAVAVSVLLAWLTYRYVESPIRTGRWRVSRSVIRWLVLAMALVGVVGLVTEQRQGFSFRVQDQTMLGDLARLDQFRSTLYPCPPHYRGKGLNWCYTSRQGTPSAALFGDSHADHLFPGITTVDEQRNWLLIGHSSCPPLLRIRSYQEGKLDECIDKNTRALEAVLDEPAIRTVVVASLGSYYIGRSLSPQHRGKIAPEHWVLESTVTAEAGLPRRALFLAGMDRTLTALERAQKQVIFIIDTPDMDFMPERCLVRPLRLLDADTERPCAIDKARMLAARSEYLAVVAELQKRHPNVRFYDPARVLCDATECYAAKPGMLLYRDSHHVSIRGSALLAKDFIGWLKTASPANRAQSR